MRLRRSLLLTSALTSIFASAYVAPSLANPLDGTISAGSATITATDKLTTITQQSDKAIIDWRGFDIGADETTQFVQPGSSSITLNRVHSNSASHIDGNLKANGNVVIVNQNGLVFGAGAVVDVQGLAATTADIDNDRFMNDTNPYFNKPGNPNASIINNGTITARDAGLVGFVAPNVANNGVINARLGRVHLASGDKATIDFYGDSLMEVEVSDDVEHQIVSQTGTINADGGTIALTAASGGHIVNSLINAEGAMRAQSIGVKNGKIIIGAAGANKTTKSGASNVTLAGALDVSGDTGGKVTITADNITLEKTATIKASGTHGGGTIKIGGDFHGEGATQTAKLLVVKSGATIENSAYVTGDGGTTALWSDGITDFNGTITARSNTGTGGYTEVSGHNYLNYNGFADLSATDGDKYGTLLLDPADITISTGGQSGIAYSAGTYTPNNAVSVINNSTLSTQLTTANVVISTTSAFAGLGDITINDPISWSSGSKSLTLNADRDITVNAAITASNATNSAITMTATRDILFNANVSAGGTGGLNATAGRNLTIGTGVTLATGNSAGFILKAGGASGTAIGALTLNGTLSLGTSSTTLSTGLDTDGVNRSQDLVVTSSNFVPQGGSTGAISITGYRDITVNRTFTFGSSPVLTATRDIFLNSSLTAAGSSSFTVTAGRNVTIGTGAIIAPGSTGLINIHAGGAASTAIGSIILNGTINAGTGLVTFSNGLDTDGVNRTQDITFTSANLTAQSSVGGISVSGYRDITFNQAYAMSGVITLVSGRDVLLNADLSTTGTNNITAQAGRNLTIAGGATINNGTGGSIVFRAGGASSTAIGAITINGTLNLGVGSLTLATGLDTDGVNRTQDLVLNSSNATMQFASIGGMNITGYRDITFNRAFTNSSTLTLTAGRDIFLNSSITGSGSTALSMVAGRNFTIGTGAIIAPGPAGTISFKAGGATSAAVGSLILNGTINAGSGAIILSNGFDSDGVTHSSDLVLNTTNLTLQGATMGGLSLVGYRDITLNRDMPFASSSTITADRDLTINGNLSGGAFTAQAGRNLTLASGKTITNGASTAISLKAGGASGAAIGTLSILGTINAASSTVTLGNGLDSDGINHTVDLVLNSSNFTQQTSTIGGLVISGFRDVTLGTAISSTGGLTLSAFRDIFLNANYATTLASNISIIANRNITIGTGAIITTGATGTTLLRAGGSTSALAGSVTISGTINSGTGVITINNGFDSDGVSHTTDLVLSSANLTAQGASIGGLIVSGFRDITLNSAYATTSGITLTAFRDIFMNANYSSSAAAAGIALNANRNITIGTGAIVGSGSTGVITLKAGGSTGALAGSIILNGTLNAGTGIVTLANGFDSDGVSHTQDLVVNSSILTTQSGTFGGLVATGYRDITISSAYTSTAGINLTAFRDIFLNANYSTTTAGNGISAIANRNVTIGAGATIASGSGSGAFTLKAGGSTGALAGSITLNGTISLGTGTLTIANGFDSDGVNHSTDLVLNTSTLSAQGASIGGMAITGFRDITLNSAYTSGGSLSLTAFRDVFLNANYTNSVAANTVSVVANRNVTIGTGAIISTGSAGAMTLRAGGTTSALAGSLTINGTLNMGTGTLTLANGFDSDGVNHTQDLVLSSATLSTQAGTIGGLGITGYRDVTFNTAYTSGGALSLTAFRDVFFNASYTNSVAANAIGVVANRNLTIASGVVITPGSAAAVSLRAGGSTSILVGALTINGRINAGTGTITLASGFDSDGVSHTLDLVLNSSILTGQGASIGALGVSGYRDVTFNTAYSTTGALGVTAYRDIFMNANFTATGANAIGVVANRNLTVATGTVITAGSTGAVSLRAGGSTSVLAGIVTLNGSISMGTGTLTLANGFDADGVSHTNDFTLTSSNVTAQGATIGPMTISGYRNVTLNADLNLAGGLSITSYNDIFFNNNVTTNNAIAVIAGHNLTVASGATLTTGAAFTVSLKSANGAVTNKGTLAINGLLNVGTANLTLLAGLDDSNARTIDLTLTTANLQMQGANIGTPNLTGFRDININRSITVANATTSIVANRNLTIGAGATITGPSTASMTLGAATGVATGTGTFTLNGTLSLGSGALTLISGLNSVTGLKADLTLNTSNFTFQGATITAPSITGFRDITLNRDLNVTGAMTITAANDIFLKKNIIGNNNISITAGRNLTLDSGATITPGSAGALVLAAANNVQTGVGVLALNGVLNLGSGLTLVSGTDSVTGLRADLTLNNTNITLQGASMGALNFSGLRDLTLASDFTTGTIGISTFGNIYLNSNLTSTASILITAGKDLTLATGKTLQVGSAANTYLKSSGGVTSAAGVLTLNGILNLGSGALTLTSGVDGSGNNVDFTFDNTHFAFQAGSNTTTSVYIMGFRDFALNTNLNLTGGATITATRNLIINNGYTLSLGNTASILNAANGVASNAGVLKLNGTLNVGSGNIVLFSALDSGTGADLTLNSSNFVIDGMDHVTSMGALTINTGRDLTIDTSINSNNVIAITSGRNMTVNSGRTLSANSVNIITLPGINGTGAIYQNGNLAVNNGFLQMISGLDSSGNRVDLALNSANYTLSSTLLSGVNVNGFRDVTINRDIKVSGNLTITADRNLTIGSGVNFTAGSGFNLILAAAGNNIARTGVIIDNGGIYNVALNSLLTLNSGLDSSGNRVDITIDNTNVNMLSTATGGLSLGGFRDININRNITSSYGVAIVAERNLTIASGVTLKTTTSAATLKAAGGNITHTGIFTNNGVVNTDTNGLILSSGLDGTGKLIDLTYDSTHYVSNAATIGAITFSGYRDITINSDIISNAAVSITAERNLTLNAGRMIASGTAAALTLKSGNTGGIGVLQINGTLKYGTFALSLTSGIGTDGNRIDYTLDNTRLLNYAGTYGSMNISGYRDINIANNFTMVGNGNFNLSAARDLNIASGVILTAGAAGSTALSAGGIYNNQGVLKVGNGALTLTSGLDTSGNRSDLTLNATNFMLVSGATTTGVITISGFRDVTLDTGITATNVNIAAYRNLNVNAGKTLKASGSMSLKAAGGVVGNTGVLTIDGILDISVNGLTLFTGADGAGNRPDLVWSDTHFLATGTNANIGTTSIQGYRDITIAKNMLATWALNTSLTLKAERNLTVNSGVNVQTGNLGLTLSAAGGNINNLGLLTLDGNLTMDASIVTMVSGVDGSGNRADFSWDSGAKYTMWNTTLAGLNLSGFRDITFNRNMPVTGAVNVVAERNLTIANGITVSGAAVTLKSAGGNVTHTGALINNGVISVGTGALVLFADANTDLIFNSSNIVAQSGTFGAVNISGFRDLTIDRDLNTGSTTSIGVQRNLTIAAGRTVNVNGSFSSYFAAGRAASNIGVLTLDGTIQSSNVTLASGVDSVTGQYKDLVIDAAHLSSASGASNIAFDIRGFRDITVNRDMATYYAGTIIAQHNLTIGNGVTIAGSNGGTTLQAAGGNMNGTGIFTNNGVLNMGIGAFTITSGLDGSGNRADLTFNNTNFLISGFFGTATTVGNVAITGFRDITLNTNLPSANGTITIQAERNLTTGNGVSVSGGYALSLKAAGGDTTHIGLLTLGGVIQGTHGVTLMTGTDSAGNRPDMVWDNSGQYLNSNGGVTLAGYRDITVNKSIYGSYTYTDTVSLAAYRNLTIGSGVSIYGTRGIYLIAAGGVSDNLGVLTLNGAYFSSGNAAPGNPAGVSFVSGHDINGNRTDLVLNNTTFNAGGNLVNVNFNGFRDILFNSAITATGAITAVATRDIALGAALSSGTTTTLAAGRNFINTAGAGALAGAARWLVYSTNPNADTIGGLAYDFQYFNCTYGAACAALGNTGNGFLYSGSGAYGGMDRDMLPVLPDSVNRLIQNPLLTQSDKANTSTVGFTGSNYDAGGLTRPANISLSFSPELAAKFQLQDWNF